MIDIHSHVLFGLDDGAADAADSRAILCDARDNGVDTVVATPHFSTRLTPEARDVAMAQLREIADPLGINVLPGCEYSNRNLPVAEPFLTLGGRRPGWIMVDFQSQSIPRDFARRVENLHATGTRWILAHPERSFDPGQYDELEIFVRAGGCFQITAASLTGRCGRKTEEFAFRLLDCGWARLVASDSHNDGARASFMAPAMRKIAARYGEDGVRILNENAAAILSAAMTEPAPLPAPVRTGLWAKIFKKQ